MADQLRRIERAGSTHPLLYAVRDVRGVQAPAAAPAELAGFNEEGDWTARADRALNNEHDSDGNHGSYKFPKAVVILTRSQNPDNTETWGIDDESWRDGKVQGANPFVSLVGDVLVFAQAWAPGGVVVQLEGAGAIRVTIVSTTQIEIDRTRVVAPAKNAEHIVFAIYEAT